MSTNELHEQNPDTNTDKINVNFAYRITLRAGVDCDDMLLKERVYNILPQGLQLLLEDLERYVDRKLAYYDYGKVDEAQLDVSFAPDDSSDAPLTIS